VKVAVFASGGGSNFQVLLDASRRSGSAASYEIALLVSDREGAGALERARRGGVPTRVIPVSGRPAAVVGEETVSVLEEAGVEVVLLAGYLRLLPSAVVGRWPRRILNVHPALLPSFGGKGMWGQHVHRAVLASGARISGPTVHFVDERYDEGHILAQWPVPVRPGDTPETLAARVLAAEHHLYPLAADHLCRALAQGVEVRPLSLPEGLVPLPDATHFEST
jgi:formyltetrahydrofolate-dependent phosphoribosylglycinamide formyltransferase